MTLALSISSFSIPFSWDGIRSGILNDPKLLFIWALIITFILATTLILFITLKIRKRKNKDLLKTKELNDKYHQYLSELASGNYSDKALELMSASKETTLALNKEDFTLDFHRKTLLKELMDLHRNIAGEAAHKLREVYLTLGYKEESLKKLKSRNWTLRVQGIQELKQMDIKDGYAPLFKMVNDKNHLVRLEAILARMKMDAQPLQLFEELEDELNEWEQLRIHHLLHQIPSEEIPSFLPLLNHRLLSVQIFATKMSALFNQAETEPILLQNLSFENTSLNQCIVESLAEIGTEKSVQYLHHNFELAKPALQVTIIKTLTNIAGEDDLDFFASQLNLESYDIQLVAAKALVGLGDKGKKHLEAASLNSERQAEIIEHARQWVNQ